MTAIRAGSSSATRSLTSARSAASSGEIEVGEVAVDAVAAELRVDRDQAAAGAQHAEHESDRHRSIPQHHADGRTGAEPELRHRVGDVGRGLVERSPWVPTALELDRRCVGIELQDRGDPRREGVHRYFGSVLASAARSTSALPIGLPSRV